jgi:hypothetical protein
MTSRNAAAPNSAKSAGRKKPATSVASGTARAELPLATAWRRGASTACSSAFAASIVLPGCSRDRLHEMRAAALRHVPGDAVPDVGVVRIRKPWHHADDGEERPVQRNRLADNRRSEPKRSRHSRWLMIAIISRELA